VVLESIPESAAGLANARTKAERALRAGLPTVGILESSRYTSLHPGYYVVFSGVFPALAQAQVAAARAHAAFPGAYAREITP
jgi:hypothetical protein